MGLSIDKFIGSLQILKNSWEVSLRNSLNKTEREIDQDIVKSLAEAIDTMRKYQKIEKIVNNTFQNIAKEDERYAYEWLGDIKEVLEDGNNN